MVMQTRAMPYQNSPMASLIHTRTPPSSGRAEPSSEHTKLMGKAQTTASTTSRSMVMPGPASGIISSMPKAPEQISA